MGRRGVPAVLALVAAILVAAAFAWHRPAREGREQSRETVVSASASPAAEAAPSVSNAIARSAVRLPEPRPTPRSPLEQSPGYFPPDDPESASVITGRREAKAVDLAFSGGAATREDLAQMLLAALNARDERALHALRVTREEFAVILWPEFPESRPITNITVEDAWNMGIAQSVAGAGRAVAENGGRDLALLRVESGPPLTYRNFVLYRDVSIVVRDHATGVESRLQFAPSFVERQGRVKVLIFRD